MLNRLPRFIQHGVRKLLGIRPESTFLRVAYTTPRQVVLVTARHEGTDNVWAVDGHLALSFQPSLYGISLNPKGLGADLVRRSGAFVVNFVPSTWQDAILYCGNVSGRNVDKFAGAQLEKEEAQSVNAPRLAKSLGALECKVVKEVPVGDHALFIGEVLHTVMRADAPRLHHIDTRAAEWGDAGHSETSTPAR